MSVQETACGAQKGWRQFSPKVCFSFTSLKINYWMFVIMEWLYTSIFFKFCWSNFSRYGLAHIIYIHFDGLYPMEFLLTKNTSEPGGFLHFNVIHIPCNSELKTVADGFCIFFYTSNCCMMFCAEGHLKRDCRLLFVSLTQYSVYLVCCARFSSECL